MGVWSVHVGEGTGEGGAGSEAGLGREALNVWVAAAQKWYTPLAAMLPNEAQESATMPRPKP